MLPLTTMRTSSTSRRHPRGAAGLLLAAVFSSLGVLPSQSSASCIASPEPEIRQLQRLIARDPAQAITQIKVNLDALASETPAASRAAPRRAALYAAQAEAYELLERSTDALSSAARGLDLAVNPNDPIRLELLSERAQNVYDEAGIAEAVTYIDAARMTQAPDSSAATCLLLTRGLLEHRQGREDLAIVSLTQAYRASAAPITSEPHILAAAWLSVVMRGMGDYGQALALNQEKIDWDTAHDSALSLSVSRFRQGQILKAMGNYLRAIDEFAEARKLSASLGHQAGVAYADLGSCEAHIELGAFAVARQECDAARAIFEASRSADSAQQTHAMQARIDLAVGRPDRALAALDQVLNQHGADMPPSDVAPLYEIRSRVNAALQNYKNAYADLLEYSHRYAAENEAERRRQAGALRARFETDREVESNASLKRALEVSQQQAERQARQLRRNAAAAVTAVGVIALLMYFLIANIRYRKQMVKLASLDGLTGLPNRRRTSEFACAALQAARLAEQPLMVAIIDMDHFKEINDCCGHATGDYVLKEVARAAGEALRPGHMMGRWGGEEFLLVMPDSTLEMAVATLERLRTLMYGIRLPPKGAGLRVSLSAGVAEFNANVSSIDELIARADRALYTAKNAGRDCLKVADATQITGSHAVRRANRQ